MIRAVTCRSWVARIAVIAALGVTTTVYLQGIGAPAPGSSSRAVKPAVSNSAVRAQASTPSSAPAEYEAVLSRYCLTCHNEKLRTGNLVLDPSGLRDVSRDAPTWEKVIRKLRTGAMPPAGRPRPDPAVYASLASSLETALDAAAASNPAPAAARSRRLNRAEYANVIRDLLALEIDAASLLPSDPSAYGFDNNAGMLRVSPALLERYLTAARKISRLAVGDPRVRPASVSYPVPPGYQPEYSGSENAPFGTRGGISIEHYFPTDGEYGFKVRLRRFNEEQIQGLFEPQQVDVWVDDRRVGSFTVEPVEAGNVGTYVPELSTQDQRMTVRAPVKAGRRRVAVTLLQRDWQFDYMGPSRLPPTDLFTGLEVRYAKRMSVDGLEVSGPLQKSAAPPDTASRRRIFVCRPATAREEAACADRILSTLARRAYRRPVTPSDLESLMSAFHAVRNEEGQFDAGIQAAIEQMLVKPEFLFQIERNPAGVAPGTVFRLSDLELASRLSFFLWSTMPDDALLTLASQGRLHDPRVLEQQVRRMLADPRATTLVHNFAMQWLQLRTLDEVKPDVKAFPEFDDNLREAFRRETQLFLESQIRENHPLPELLTADYTFVNERLARHYGIPDVYESRFRRVTLPGDKRRGLLGQGSILTVTSPATRTSPVIRGKWVLENILDTPPPPPPPNVPALPETGGERAPATMRERMEQHRKNPVCAACHTQMDPFGFALENFDGIGAWRTSDAGQPIDAASALPDGTRIAGAADLRTMLSGQRREQFVDTVTTRLMTYALGRGVEYSDMPAIRKIVREAAAKDYRWSAIVLGLVTSQPFQMRKAAS